MSIIAVIPARGGSKGLPRKNLVGLNDRPLIAYAIDAALNAEFIDRVIVSTDNAHIAEIAISLGAEVPFLRPANLSNDTAPMIGVLQHLLGWLDLNEFNVEAIVLLQPTSPLRMPQHIQEAIQIFRSSRSTSVVSVVEVPHQYHPLSVMRIGIDGYLMSFVDTSQKITRRQDKPRVYARNGPAILVCNPDTLRSGELYGDMCTPYLMSHEESIDIDTYEDLIQAEKMLKERKL